MSGTLTLWSRAEAEEAAADRDLVCIVPTDYELTIDLDDLNLTGSNSTLRLDVLESMTTVVRGEPLYVISQSGEGLHVYVRLWVPFRVAERVALQAALGSDPIREMLSIQRLAIMIDETDLDSVVPVMLFETPASAEAVADWRARFPTEEDNVEEWRAVMLDAKPARGIRLREGVSE